MVNQRIFVRFPRLLIVMVTLSLLSAIFFVAGPLYMIQLYSNILPTRSNETLLVATFFVIIAFVGFWAIERTRLRIASRWAAKLDEAIGGELENCHNECGERRKNFNIWKTLRGFMNSSAFLALFDLPASLVLLSVLAYIHPLLAGFVILILVISFSFAGVSFFASNQWNNQIEKIGRQQQNLSRHLTVDSSTLLPKQSQLRIWDRWLSNERSQYSHQQKRSETIGGGNTIIKSSRVAAQSMLLGLGAWLIMRDDMPISTLLAASVLGARALAPYDALAQSFGSLQSAFSARKTLKSALGKDKQTSEDKVYGKDLIIQNLMMALPGTRTYFFKNLSLHCPKGSVTLLVGPSGSGKSALLAVSAGVLPFQQGKIIHPEKITYQPLQARFIEGSILDNLVHLNDEPESTQLTHIIDQFALTQDLENLNLSLNSTITVFGSTPEGRVLPGNFLRKLALARSLIEDPDLVLWDQPFNGLDRQTREQLVKVVTNLKQKGKTVVITADPYPKSLPIDNIVMLKDGVVHKEGLGQGFLNKNSSDQPNLKMMSSAIDSNVTLRKNAGNE